MQFRVTFLPASLGSKAIIKWCRDLAKKFVANLAQQEKLLEKARATKQRKNMQQIINSQEKSKVKTFLQ